ARSGAWPRLALSRRPTAALVATDRPTQGRALSPTGPQQSANCVYGLPDMDRQRSPSERDRLGGGRAGHARPAQRAGLRGAGAAGRSAGAPGAHLRGAGRRPGGYRLYAGVLPYTRPFGRAGAGRLTGRALRLELRAGRTTSGAAAAGPGADRRGDGDG